MAAHGMVAVGIHIQHLTALLLASMLEALCDKIALAMDDFLLIAAQCRAVQPCISNIMCLLQWKLLCRTNIMISYIFINVKYRSAFC